MCDYCKKQKMIRPDDGYIGWLYDPPEKQRHAFIVRDENEVAIHFIADGNGTYFNIKYCPFCGEKLTN